MEVAEEPTLIGLDIKITELTQLVKTLSSRLDRVEMFTTPIAPRGFRPDPLSEYGDPLR